MERDGALSFARAAAGALRDVRARRGDRVGVLLPNSARAAATYFGIWREGLTAVPVSLSLPREEQRFILERTDARVLIASDETAEVAGELAASLGETGRVVRLEKIAEAAKEAPPFEEEETPFVHPEDVGAIFFTSGTTGRPKGVMLSHRALLADAEACQKAFDFGCDDALSTAIPLFHCFSMTVCLLLPAFCGGRARLFTPGGWVEGLKRDAGTVVGVPSLFAPLLAEGVSLGGAVRFLSGGAALAPSVREALAARHGVPIFEGYGTTECAPVVSVQRPGAEGPPDGVGRPLDGVRVEIRDAEGRPLPAGEVGEVAVGGEILMSGYYDLPAVTRRRLRGGFFHTGDLGFLDEGGYLHIVDRIADAFLRQGLTIYPHEIEEVLREHPEVREAAVLGSPEATGEEVPIAICVPSDPNGPRPGLAEDLIDFAARRLPIYKVPVRVEFRSDLPKTATGKVVKRALRQKWA